MLPYITTRELQLCQEFAFLPSSPPHAEGGIFELRSYQLTPGTLLEWEHTWCAASLPFLLVPYLARLISLFGRRLGIEARRKFVEPVGAWFSQVGRLNNVHHMWQYP